MLEILSIFFGNAMPPVVSILLALFLPASLIFAVPYELLRPVRRFFFVGYCLMVAGLYFFNDDVCGVGGAGGCPAGTIATAILFFSICIFCVAVFVRFLINAAMGKQAQDPALDPKP